MNVEIIIAAHKPYQMPLDTMYLPLHVGAKEKESIGFQRDDEGENISDLNPYFCELTGLFWAWKNLDADYIGLVHYRRHFTMHPHSKEKWEAVLKYDDIKNDIGKIKVFVPEKRRYYIETLYSHYAHTHYINQLDVTENIIYDQCPEYLDSYKKTILQRWGYMFNMMIMERSLFGAYCGWLFDILFELRNRKGEEGLSPFHRRYYGRVSEIIFNVWLKHQLENGSLRKEEMRELPCIHMEKINWRKKGTAFLQAKFFGKRYESGF